MGAAASTNGARWFALGKLGPPNATLDEPGLSDRGKSTVRQPDASPRLSGFMLARTWFQSRGRASPRATLPDLDRNWRSDSSTGVGAPTGVTCLSVADAAASAEEVRAQLAPPDLLVAVAYVPASRRTFSALQSVRLPQVRHCCAR